MVLLMRLNGRSTGLAADAGTGGSHEQQYRSSHRRGATGDVFDGGPSDVGGLGSRFVRESPLRVDPDLAGEVAARFQAARNDHTNTTVRAAYEQLERQSDVIYAQLTDPDHPLHRGVRVEFTGCESPYDSDDELVGAVRTHRVLEITTSARERHRRHPLLGCDLGGTYDRFRAVHDIVGHVGPCLGFDRDGEFAAWLTQEQLYDGLARWALATELHAEHSVLWTSGTLPDHRATLIDRDLLNRIRNASTTVSALTPPPSFARFEDLEAEGYGRYKRLFEGAAHEEEERK